MRIGLITQWGESGAGYVSRAYKDALSLGHDLFVFARSSGGGAAEETWKGRDVYWAKPHPCTTGFSVGEFGRWVARNRIDAVLFNEQRWWEGVVAAQRLGLLVGAYVDYYTAETIRFFQLYDFVVCNTQRHAAVFADHPQILYCPWGTDVEAFRPVASQSSVASRQRFFISAGFAGSKVAVDPSLDRRGVGFALRAMTLIKDDCELIIHSQAPLSTCPENWRSMIAADSRIQFYFATVPPPGLYHLGSVYVYPARLDGIGLTVPEALSCGLPAIVTNSAPMTEFVHDGINGSVVKVEKTVARHDGYYWPEALVDVGDLARVMATYTREPSKASEQGVRARVLATETLDWRRNSAGLAEQVARVKKIVNMNGARISELIEAVRRYDYLRQPTPFQLCKHAAKRQARYLEEWARHTCRALVRS